MFPDAAIVLEIEDTDAVARLLPSRLARWRSRRQQLLDRRQQRKERKRQRREAAIERRRAKLQKEADKRKAEREVWQHVVSVESEKVSFTDFKLIRGHLL